MSRNGPSMGGRSADARERIVFPLDFSTLEEATAHIKILKDRVGLFKIGLMLFMREGIHGIRVIERAVGNRIFLDLKLFDIPETVAGACSTLKKEGIAIRFLTVHASGGEAMVEAAVNHVNSGTQVLGVTVLTSIGEQDSPLEGKPVSLRDRVIALAGVTSRAGAAGVVCSGDEAKSIREKYGRDLLVVTPGIRPSWTAIREDDQRRIMTPREAILQGADYLVIGRPIHHAPDPRKAAERIEEEIDGALKSIRPTT